MMIRESVKRLKKTEAGEKACSVLTATTESEWERLDENRLAGWQESEASELLVGYLARIKWGRLPTPNRRSVSPGGHFRTDGVARNQPRPFQLFVQGHGDVARIHHARDHLGQERAAEHVAGRTHQEELGVALPEPLLQLMGAGEPREAGADDQDAWPAFAIHGQTVVVHNVVSSSRPAIRRSARPFALVGSCSSNPR
jgi:hypothetical protein